MKQSWTLDLSGSTHRLDVDWDLVMTSRGEAFVDGARVHSWLSWVKLPGVIETFAVAGHPITVRQGMMSFDLDLRASPGVRVLDGPPPYAGDGRNLTRRDGLIVGLAITAALIMLVVGAMLFGSAAGASQGARTHRASAIEGSSSSSRC